MMSVGVALGTDATVGTPRPLFEFNPMQLGMACYPVSCFVVSPDGQRFFATQPVKTDPPPPATQIHFVQNWLAELEAKVPSGM